MLWFMVSYHDLWAKKIVKLPLMMPGYTHRSPLGVSSLHNGLKSEKIIAIQEITYTLCCWSILLPQITRPKSTCVEI